VKIQTPPKPLMLSIGMEAALYVTMATVAPPNPHIAFIVAAMCIWLAAQVLAATTGLIPMPPSGLAGRTFLFFGVDVFLVSALFQFGPGLIAGVLLAITGAVLLFSARKEL
jgi:hypothetical protein